MTDVPFARLIDSPPREAWANEARDFTPWLVQNMDRLSDALGFRLEATGMEVAVEQFSADIVATDIETGDRILIENQLEGSDHTHLGQILTYLAGLEAKAVIWIARDFDEAHLSAMRWLNEYTAGDFAFFAIRLRVVRIGESPFAPVFEIVEKPNTWERKLGKTVNEAEAERTRLREEYWSRYLQRHPGLFKPTRLSNVWLSMLPDESVFLSLFVGSSHSGMFLRGPHGTDGKELATFMERNRERLDKAFGPSPSAPEGHYYVTKHDVTLWQKDRWDELIDWMDERRRYYSKVINSTLDADKA